MTIVCISQARMTSTRLPGKVLMEVCGKSLLDYHVERLSRSNLIDKLVVATTSNDTDDPIVSYCEKKNIPSFRGSETDVLERFYHCAKLYKADVVVRVTSDCPLIDPVLVDAVIEQYLERSDRVDYVALDDDKFPRGLDVEVFSFAALQAAYEKGQEPYHREHVTPYIYLNQNQFTCEKYTTIEDHSSHRWCVDEPADFELISNILEAFEGRNDFTWQECLTVINKHPQWQEINQQVHQKTLDE